MELSLEEVLSGVKEILGPGGEVDLDTEDGKISGYVAHPIFSGYSVPERRKLLRDALKERFGERATEIGILLLYSPEEYREMAS